MSEMQSQPEEDRRTADYSELTDPDSLFDPFPDDKELKAPAVMNESDSQYNRKIGAIELLTPAQEQELGAINFRGNQAEIALHEIRQNPGTDVGDVARLEALIAEGAAAREELVVKNLRFAAFMARESMNLTPYGGRRERKNGNIVSHLGVLAGGPVEYADRVQIANIGLMKAAKRFDGQTNRFTTYASWQIEGDLIRHIADENTGGRFPDGIIQSIKQVQRERSGVAESHGGMASDHDVANNLGITEEEVSFLTQLDESRRVHYLEDIIALNALRGTDDYEGESDEPITIADQLHASDGVDTTLEDAARKLAKRDIAAKLETLTERQKNILKLRFGLDTNDSYTLDEIGRELGLTRERIRQIESSTLSRMRHPFRSQALRGYIVPESPISHHRNIYDTGQEKLKTRSVDQELFLGSDSEFDWEDEPWEYDKPEYAQKETLSKDEHEKVGELFTDELMTLNPYLFQKAFLAGRKHDYPQTIMDRMENKFGDKLRPDHIEEFWNAHLQAFTEKMILSDQEDEMSYDEIGKVFTALLRKSMTDTDVVDLNIPEMLSGKIGSVGAGFEHGLIVVNGDLGDNVGNGLAALGRLEIFGNVGNGAGRSARGYANLIINGDCGNNVGAATAGQAYIEIKGDAGEGAGSQLGGEAHLVVGGNVSDDLGHGMNGNAEIYVGGSAGRNVGKDAVSGDIHIAGDATTFNVPSDFTGNLSIRGYVLKRGKDGRWTTQ